MRHADKNRDPQKARARAASDARCALRKLAQAMAELDLYGLAQDLDLALEAVERAKAAIEGASE